MSLKESFKEKGLKWWKYTKITTLVILMLALAFVIYILFANYSSGSRTGYITKISHKGYIFKTYEGELNFGFFGGSSNNGKPSENIWQFSVSNAEVAKQAEFASKSGHKVTLYYHQKYVKIALRGDTDYIVYKIEKSDEPGAPLLPIKNQNQ